MNRVLVTGGAGFIGSHLVDRLVKEGKEVIVIDNLSEGRESNLKQEYFNSSIPKAKLYKFDIRDFDKINPLFKGVDFVFHLAAIPRVPISVDDPVTTSEVNILGTVNVFKASVDAGVKRVVFSSSSSVYGNQDRLPLEETMIPNPLSPYALQKLSGEQFAKLFFNLYGIQIVSLRYFNVYGPRIDFESETSLVLGKFLKQKSKGRPLTIYGDGEQTRAFCYVDDVVDANIKVATSDKIKGGEIINIGSEKDYSINYLADLVGGEKKYLSPRKGDVSHTKANISQAKKLISWEPRVSLEEGFRRTKEWFDSVDNSAGTSSLQNLQNVSVG